MNKKIWVMEGLSSQRDIICGINDHSISGTKTNVMTYASHRHARNEILSVAHVSLIEPADPNDKLSFISDVIKKTNINAIHVGRNCRWFESHRADIEAFGVTLTTGATAVETFDLADDKVTFATYMAQNGLPVVPSVRVSNVKELSELMASSPFPEQVLCVKPVTGIYGMGFWRFDDSATFSAPLNNPDNRRINPAQYLAALAACETFDPLVLMPWLPGPEYSVDILADKGKVLAAIGRRKEGAIQYLVNSGDAFDLACRCAAVMKADGLVNVQTRNDTNGHPLLLEINLRPSGGIGYTRHSGVNLPGLFAWHKLGLLSQDAVKSDAVRCFSPAAVRSVTDVLKYETELKNQLRLTPADTQAFTEG